MAQMRSIRITNSRGEFVCHADVGDGRVCLQDASGIPWDAEVLRQLAEVERQHKTRAQVILND